MSFLALLSPAKKMHLSGPRPDGPLTQPQFKDETHALIQTARAWQVCDIARRMNLSDALAQLNYARYQAFHMGDADQGEGEQQAALFAFHGDVYQGLDAASLTPEQVLSANDQLRILSGLYGLLRPLDLIQAYRLEMGLGIETAAGSSLYAYWGSKIAHAINAAAARTGATHVVNLASQEYFKAVDRKALTLPVLTCQFKELRQGKPTIISFNAKRARGLMARYLVTCGAQTLDELKAFAVAGYRFAADLSDAATFTFLKQA